MAAPVTVYRTEWCPYCIAAKRFLSARGIAFDEVYLDRDPAKMAELKARLEWRTVPMIFVGDTFVGGYTDLRALDQRGELQALLAAAQ
ncbi:MAG: glutaredoxin [Deltaproteobacteria bacterium]|nr:glutaredoxin [Deltaproteobacteria bacterium]